MKRKLIAVPLLMALTGAAVADSKSKMLTTQFRQMAEECQLALDGATGYQLPKGAAANLAACYGHKVKVSFQEARHSGRGSQTLYGDYLTVPRFAYGRDRQKMLRAALQAEPTLATTAYTAALQSRMPPALAYRVASATLPAAASSFASTAIAYGADPSTITAATAAGANQD